MMKSPTSLIRFRNAVGVMLALSAVFAVVISAVTFTDDRALADHGGVTHVEVSISVDPEADTADESGSVTVTVSLNTDLASGESVIIPLVGEAGTAEATEFGQPSRVTISPDGDSDNDSATATVQLTSADGVLEDLESFTVKLAVDDASWPAADGYVASDDDTVTIYISDADNDDPSPATVTITVKDNADPPVDVDATGAKVDQTLTANTSAVVDPDNADDRTTDAEDDAVALTFSYQWQRVVTGGDNVNIGTDSSTYTPNNDDVGEELTVVVTSVDQYDNGNGGLPFDLTTSTTLDETVYDKAKPFIIVGALDPSGDDMRIEPDVILTRDSSGFMVNDAGNLISGFDEMGDPVEVMVDLDGPDCAADATDCDEATDPTMDDVPVALTAVTFTWHRDGMAIEECATNGEQTIPRPDTDISACTDTTYTLTDDDVAKDITLVATYTTRSLVPGNTGADPVVPETPAVMASIPSEDIGRVYSPNKSTGQPTISGTGQIGQSLTVIITGIDDDDGLKDVMYTYQWKRGDDEVSVADPTTYPLTGADIGKKITVEVTFKDDLGDESMIESAQTISIGGSPGEISKIEPGINGITVSGGDVIMLSVDIYGLQGVKDNDLAGTFTWSVDGETDADLGDERVAKFTASDDPGRYTVVALLAAVDCLDEGDEDACRAEFEVAVRRGSPPQPPEDAPANPPGVIPGILADSDGNQYEVFTPEEGGTFTGEGYSLKVDAGAVPNGEFLGIRMSDEGAASNLGMTHQRYTLGGNMYAISAVDSSQAAISSYVLDDAALACVPLPDELRSNISDLALVAINSDGSLTILAAQVRISPSGNMVVCGALSNLPASVAVGSSGAPAAIPTPTPEPTVVPPETGGTAPASSMVVLWSLLLGVAVFALGSVLVIARRREGARTR